MFHDMFVYESGLGRVQGTKNETLAEISAKNRVGGERNSREAFLRDIQPVVPTE